MKAYHLLLLFLVFFFAAVIKTDINIGEMKTVQHEKETLDSNLDSATWDAIAKLSQAEAYGTNKVKKDDVVNTFLSSLYSSLGIMYNADAKNLTELYIPVILLCDTDGYYIYYFDKYKTADGLTETSRIWSEKIPYYYQDRYFYYRFCLDDTVTIYDVNHLLGMEETVLTLDYHEIQVNDTYAAFRDSYSDSILLDDETYELVKKGAIQSQLEKVLAYYTSRHNDIASQHGITYTFSFPSGDEDGWAQYMDDVSMVVVFQGYPYGDSRNYVYNKIASCGANVTRKTKYYVEKKGWYYLAHVEGCPGLKKNVNVLEEPLDSIEECVKLGAYCDDCIDYGARAPEIE